VTAERPRLIRVDLSPPDFIHVPQAPRIDRHEILARDANNEWQMWGVCGRDASGVRVGLSNHTWSHLDAPYHLLPHGATFDRLDPRSYLALRTRVVDLTQTAPERRENIDNVSYHSYIGVEDLPADIDSFDAVLFITGFSRLFASGYPMKAGADAHYPSVARDAAEHLAAQPSLRVVAIDGPSVDKPETHAIAHRVLLGRQPPVLLLETLYTERLLAALSPLPAELLLTVEPLRAFGREPDGALCSVYAYTAAPGEDVFFRAFADAMRTASLEG
jgi:kynurenine formamidase